MKVTEYPGTSFVPRTSNEGKSALRFPELETQSPVHQLGQPTGPTFEPDRDLGLPRPLHGVDQAEQRGTVQPIVPDSAARTEPLRPVPQDQPLPELKQSEPEQ